MRRTLPSSLRLLGLVLCGLVLVSTQSWGQGNCYTSSIMSPTPFMGTNDEIFQLSDQSVWQVKYEYEYLYEYYPAVTICPDINKLIIDDKQLDVLPISRSGTRSRRVPSQIPDRSAYAVSPPVQVACGVANASIPPPNRATSFQVPES